MVVRSLVRGKEGWRAGEDFDNLWPDIFATDRANCVVQDSALFQNPLSLPSAYLLTGYRSILTRRFNILL